MNLGVLPKYKISGEILIERSLPCVGEINVKKGSIVQAFDKIGNGKMVLDEMEFAFEGELLKKRGDFVGSGEVISKKKKSIGGEVLFKSPTTGYIVKVDKETSSVTIRKPSRNFDLIAGVPGFVTSVIPTRGALITTRGVVVKGAWAWGDEVGGELVVIGDNDDDLTQELFEGDFLGKIVVCGRLNKEAYSKGKAMGVSGFICGSCNWSFVSTLKKDGPAIFVTEGFGEIPLSPILFEYLKSVSLRFVILRACEAELIVPEPENQKWCQVSNTYFTKAKVGQVVQIFSFPFYGFFAKVTSVSDEKNLLSVEIWGKKKTIEVRPENIGAITI